ncbi:hypothetical protein V6N13_046939 [Hibiscus sabdariffa]|uniref:Gamma-glutamylcyclotransferase AIG2-like domain-containing protein n=1 Tax=Hibiscus sabdariffa TaxID=183260 RepID=A0ABR2ASN9_9ROSI
MAVANQVQIFTYGTLKTRPWKPPPNARPYRPKRRSLFRLSRYPPTPPTRHRPTRHPLPHQPPRPWSSSQGRVILGVGPWTGPTGPTGRGPASGITRGCLFKCVKKKTREGGLVAAEAYFAHGEFRREALGEERESGFG